MSTGTWRPTWNQRSASNPRKRRRSIFDSISVLMFDLTPIN